MKHELHRGASPEEAGAGLPRDVQASSPKASVFYVAQQPTARVNGLVEDSRVFHRSMTGYIESPLLESTRIATALGLRRVWIKDESTRFGLPAYKTLGAAYAAHRALGEHLGEPAPLTVGMDQMAERVAGRPITLVAPTDGNHGKAVARYASMLGLSSHILLPEGTAAARVAAIGSEDGARAEVLPTSYLGAVRHAVDLARDREDHVLVTDFDDIGTGPTPSWVIDGYSTIFSELDEQLEAAGAGRPAAAVVQVGAGALACAVARWACGPGVERVPILSVEPADAACLLESLAARKVKRLAPPFTSVMAGLNCDAPSRLAFEELNGAVDAAVGIDDHCVSWAMQVLASEGIEAGESGAAGLAGLAVTMLDPGLSALREACGLGPEAEVVIFVTEKITDPVSARVSLSRVCSEWPVLP